MRNQRPARSPDRRPGGVGSTYLVECFAATVADIHVADDLARTMGLQAAGTLGSVGYVATLALPDDELVFLIISGADPGSVRTACLAAGLAVERVTEVTIRRGEWPPAPLRARDHRARRAAGCRR